MAEAVRSGDCTIDPAQLVRLESGRGRKKKIKDCYIRPYGRVPRRTKIWPVCPNTVVVQYNYISPRAITPYVRCNYICTTT
jgi:hypothetical protein